ncbi:MAG: efflux RND transporter periplasmic adaptor subunit [Pseudomonadota bacterium]|nr:efflux RND transporter periplasmic adaptor subunit [Pseudomonadota bacterium]
MNAMKLVVLALFFPALALAEEPSVLITTQEVHQGSMPQIVTAYGTVEPLPDGVTNISMQRAGQVASLSVAPGQQVQQGDVLLSFTSDPAALLAYDQAVTALEAATKEQSRVRQLLAQRLATQSQLTQANKALSDAQSTLEVEKKEGSDLKTQILKAPYDGTVTNISVNSGDRVAANAVLLQLTHGSGLAVGLGLPLNDRAHLQIGQPVQLHPLDTAKPAVAGNVAFVGNMLDPKTRLVKVQVTIPSEAAKDLVAGEQFQAEIEVGKLTGTIVPRQSVLNDDRGSYIYQVNGDQAARTGVKLVGESGGDYVIDGPIDVKKEIITEGNYELKDGGHVRTSSHAEPKAEP